MTRIVGLLSLTLICSTIAAQDANKKQQDKDTIRYIDISNPSKNSQYPPYMVDVPNVIPPSPEVATLFRYSEFAVNHSSGLANINIPIYTIKYGPITLPVSISYDHSGRRHGERTGSIGLGWAFNTGAMISRTINGKPDEQMTHMPLGDLTASTIMSNINNQYYSANQRASNFELMKDIYENTNNAFDSEYDIYTYFIPGHSGKFIIYNGSPMLLDNKPVIITGNGSPNHGFQITDDKGIKYTFRITEYTTGAYQAITAWGLDKVQSHDNKYTVTFGYHTMQTVHSASSQAFLNVRDRNAIMEQEQGGQPYVSNTNGFDEYYTSTSSYSYNMYRLNTINFVIGELEIESEAMSLSEPKINKIKLKNNNGATIQRICQFNRSMLDAAGYQKLDGMTWFKPDGTTVLERYSFEYNASSIQYINPHCDPIPTCMAVQG